MCDSADVKLSANKSAKAPKNITLAQRKARNQNIISKMGCNFVYAPNSKIFHRCDCKLILGAVSVQGCTYYRTATKKRRPCKVCKPLPNTKANKPQDMNAVIKVRLVGGQINAVKLKNIVGFCHNRIHQGKLTEKLMEDHDCIGKQCRFFEKYENAAYWVAMENRRKERQNVKKQKQLQKQKKADEEKTLDELKRQFQSYIDELCYPMRIIRLELAKPNVYRVFYVSDNTFADGWLYPNFYAAVTEHYPSYRLLLRHIQDIDGHFVTREEYARRFGN